MKDTKKRLFKVMSILNENFDPLNEAREDLIDYFREMWSKSPNVNQLINSNGYLKKKYTPYIQFTDNQWAAQSEETLKKLWDEWASDDDMVQRGLYEDEYIASDDEMDIARKTSRTQRYDPELKKGRGLNDAIVPSFAMNIALKTQMVLDFGAGKHPFYVMKYRDMGFNIYGWDLPESMRYWEENYEEEIRPPDGLSGQFDLVYASNVMNVAPNENFLRRMTLDTIKRALKPSGIYIGNYPASPRKNPEMTPAMLKGILEEYFMGVQYFNDKKIYVCTHLK